MDQPTKVNHLWLLWKKGHLKHECEIQVMIDWMKDLEFKLQKKGNWFHGQVNVVYEVFVPKEKLNVEEEVEDFVKLGNNVEAYTIGL